MKRQSKKGFTIVELVIVIAIIAILAAVLIPTFSGVIEQARISADTQLLRNLNTALKADNKQHNNMTDALEAAEKFGYLIDRINASATNNEILWDSENDAFCYYNDETKVIEYVPETQLKEPKLAVGSYKYWAIVKLTGTEVTCGVAGMNWSVYLASSVKSDLTASTGVDVGNCDNIASITYSRLYTEEKQDVVIRTNSANTTLTIDDKSESKIYHYGSAGALNIIECHTASYHEYGKVAFAEIAKGRIALEKGAEVEKLHFDATTAKEFEEIIVAADPSVTLPEFSRDEANIKDTGTLVVELQKDTNNNDETEKDYVWLYKQGVISQIVVVDEKIEGIEKQDDKFVATDNHDKVVALGVSDKSTETQKAVVEIANNYTGSNYTPQTIGGKEVKVPALDENNDVAFAEGETKETVIKNGLTTEEKTASKDSVVNEAVAEEVVEKQATCAHEFEDGVCKKCGLLDPSAFEVSYVSAGGEAQSFATWKEFAEFANSDTNKCAGGTATLLKDISINNDNYTQIKTFKGTFDGNNKTINIEITDPTKSGGEIAIFATIEDGTAQNVNITGSITSNKYAAGLAIKLQAKGSNAYIKNVHTDVDVTSKYKTGGIIVNGYGNSQNYTAVIDNCINEGNINSTGYQSSQTNVGGICAYNTTGSITISNCINKGNITVTNNTGGKTPLGIGGIIGALNYDSQKGTYEITKCYNTAVISSNGGNVGQIVGRICSGGQSISIEQTYLFYDLYALGELKALAEGTILASFIGAGSDSFYRNPATEETYLPKFYSVSSAKFIGNGTQTSVSKSEETISYTFEGKEYQVYSWTKN